ncbi:hypothetical protein [Burkholderia sp. 9120]|uniref:hypothetical protein n=1 Tax=Burkholderia sp. 9120 TaxID=1500897 RepID=UPI000554296F|nr:hypothetical protein [Burkholderia sp. 9120]
MITTSNIENFDLLTARIFASLYENFPVGISLQASKYGVDVDKAFADFSDIDGPTFKALNFFCATVRWLSSAGYIEFETETNGGVFFDATLTSKGLEVLKATPASLDNTPDGTKTIGEYLVDGAKNGVTEAMKKGVTYALSTGASLAWNAVLTAVR